MKNLIKIFCLFVLSFFAQAQEKEPVAPKDYTATMDSLLQYVKKDQMKTGLLYDRVVANANLLEFNTKESKSTSSYWHYIQALSEVHRASLDPKNVMPNEVVEDLRHKKDNVLNISYINTSLDYIDYGTEESPNLVFKDGYFYTLEDRNPFKQKQVTVVAALAENLFNPEIKIRLNPDLMYQDDSNPIKNLTATLNGTEIKLVTDFENLKDETRYKVTGDEKEMVFYIEFKDETKIQTRSSFSISLPQVNVTTASAFPLEEDFIDSEGIDRNSPENTFPFQGYNETAPIHGVLEYRTYYNTVTNNGAVKSKINKPIIILDGFDPGDKRKIYQGSIGYDHDHSSLYELMTYDPDTDPFNNNNQNFVKDILRPRGYDVTLVNFPENKMVDPVQPTRPFWVQTGPFWFFGHWTTVTNYLHLADGGADYIERNAMAVVALLKRENAKLAANGSTEQITLVGPSMGGLISRYALAYMEKNHIPHNVKLWVSFDSPHLGANIPIATQENIYFFGQFGQNLQAKQKFHENFASPAARQMLIEQLDYKHQNYGPNDNPRLWMLESNPLENNLSFRGQNNNSPFRNKFINALENNGIANSSGFPTNVRKIALINGTTNGAKTNLEGQLFLELAGFKPSWNKAVAFEDRNLAPPGKLSQTFAGKVTIPSSASDFEIFLGGLFGGTIGAVIVASYPDAINSATTGRLNINPRGSMDVVQGGMYDTQSIIRNDFQPGLDNAGVSCDWRVHVKNHAFIPTVSSLAFKNPNFDWSAPLNRNLICDPNNKEIPFDSYFSPSNNEEHVSLTKESVDWLLSEIQGNPQAPRFDVNKSALVGLKQICENQITNYSFGTDICKLPSLVQSWTVSSTTLQVISSNGFNIKVKGIGNGQGTITATFQNGQTVTKTIWVGKPSFTFEYTYYDIQPIKSTLCVVSTDPTFSLEQQGVTSVSFTGVRNFNANCIRTTSPYCKEATVTSACGTVKMKNDCVPFKQSANNASAILDYYTLSPNPSNDVVAIALVDQNNLPEKGAVITGELFNMMGISQSKVELIENKATFSVKGLNHGIYVLKIYINNQVESHQIAVE